MQYSVIGGTRGLAMIAGATLLGGVMLAVDGGAHTAAQLVGVDGAGSSRVVVQVTGTLVDSDAQTGVEIFASGQVAVGLGAAARQPLTDTLRLARLPSFSADVTEGELHIRIRGAGRVELQAKISGGPAADAVATG
jgi:hypothetical protein